MRPVEQYQHAGFTVSIYPDTDAPNPVEEFDFPGDNDLAAWEAGEVYGFIVTDDCGRHIDSCWGFYGADSWDYMLSVANESAHAEAMQHVSLLAY